jgi:phenylacetate-CoA ligase
VSKLQRGLGLFAPIPVSVFSGPSKQISVIESVRPDLIDGYSSSLLLLAREVERRGLDTIKPRMLFGGAELSDEISREYIERVFDAPFYDRYATVELERVAWQCPHKKYHIDADTLLLEFVDENGETVAPGEKGEVVCTSLFNYAMPFIRYALGDVGVRSDEECTCGRTFPLMKVVEGRKDSLVILPDGRTLSPRTFTLAMRMFSSYKDISQFRVVQEKHDLLEFHIKKKNDDIPDETIKEGLLYHIRRTLNIDPDQVKIKVRFVTSIPLNKGGKLMAVVSKVKRERLLR